MRAGTADHGRRLGHPSRVFSANVARLVGRALASSGRLKSIADESAARQWNEEIIRLHQQAMWSLVVDVAAVVPAYRSALDANVGVDGIASLPITPRSALRRDIQSFVAPNPGKVELRYTSGTGGPPTRSIRPWSTLLERAAVERRWYEALGLPAFFTLVLCGLPSEAEGYLWTFRDWRVACRNVALSQLLEGFNKGERPGELILAPPSILAKLVNAPELPGVGAVASSFGGSLPTVEQTVRKRHGLRFGEEYVAAELSAPLAARADPCHRLHINTDYFIVDVVDQHNQPVPDRTAGKIIVTDLLNTAMPLVRYELGDVVVRYPADDCGCGRSLPLIEVIGRRVERLRTPSGHIRAEDIADQLDRVLRRPAVLRREGAMLHIFCVGGEGVDSSQASRVIRRWGLDCEISTIPSNWESLLEGPILLAFDRSSELAGDSFER